MYELDVVVDGEGRSAEGESPVLPAIPSFLSRQHPALLRGRLYDEELTGRVGGGEESFRSDCQSVLALMKIITRTGRQPESVRGRHVHHLNSIHWEDVSMINDDDDDDRRDKN